MTMYDSEAYHQPALLKESIDGLNIRDGKIYVDATFGGGGHSKEILKFLKKGKLIAFDQDEDAERNARQINDKHFIFLKQNFRFLKNNLRLCDALPVSGIIADLGVSSHQFDTAERGFSFRFEAEPDMRMNKKNPLTAKEIINNYSEEKLEKIFREYGEIQNARKLANEIVNTRKNKAIQSVKEFLSAIGKCVFKRNEPQYLAQVFQALRIEVNDEINILKEFLKQSLDVLETGGRLVIISYHSLEDRLVKNFFRSGNFEGEIEKDFFGNTQKPMNAIGKLIVPSEEEIKINPRVRSAKLRIAEKLGVGSSEFVENNDK